MAKRKRRQPKTTERDYKIRDEVRVALGCLREGEPDDRSPELIAQNKEYADFIRWLGRQHNVFDRRLIGR